MNILQTIFLSSAGNGNISSMWKGALVVAIAAVFPGTAENEAMQVIDMGIMVAGIVWTFYGAVMKIVRRRWSAV